MIFILLAPTICLYLAYAFHEVGVITVFWCYPAVLAFYFMLPERQAWIANIVLLTVVLPQAWQVLEFELAIRLFASLVMISAFSAIFVRVISELQNTLQTQALIDPLTGLLNRTMLHETLSHAIEQNHRMNFPMTLILLDLDHFKTINDSFGHDGGDAVLQDVGQYLAGRIRHSDKVFRLGGEEFLIVMYNADTVNGLQLAEELRSGISSLLTHSDKPITASFGIATLEPEESWDEWMKRSDENLYRAKSEGRNRVVS